MTKRNLFLLLGIILILLSIWQIYSAQNDIQIIRTEIDNLPATVYKPSSTVNHIPPVVFVAHGFAGSQNVMSAFAFTLSHAGFSVITWDFNGHGSNSIPFNPGDRSNALLENADKAFSIASDMGLIQGADYAILGHSMGSGVALTYGQKNPETKATIAVSPVIQTVTPVLPKNLLLMAGSREMNFVRNAEEILEQAGGEGGDPGEGNARELIVIPNVEHISILFSNKAHEEARAWLESIFGVQPNAKRYTDNRLIWYLIGIVGFVIVSNTLPHIGLNSSSSKIQVKSLWRKLIYIIIGAFVGTLLLWVVSRIGMNFQNIFNLLVGGYIILWFGVCGIICLFIVRFGSGFPEIKTISAGLIGFSLLWLGVGLLGRTIWLEWLLIPKRLIFWPVGALLILPWFLFFGELIRDSKFIGLVGWWLVQSIVVIAGLLLSIRLIPDIGFLILILPMVPVLIALHMLFTLPWGRGWVFGISGSMFISWALFAVFPIV